MHEQHRIKDYGPKTEDPKCRTLDRGSRSKDRTKDCGSRTLDETKPWMTKDFH